MRYRRYQSRDTSPRTITAKYDGVCACCSGAIKAGAMVDYYPAKKQIFHLGGMDGNSGQCSANIRAARTAAGDPGFVDLDRMVEDQWSDICGR
jgi:hypothetical protein